MELKKHAGVLVAVAVYHIGAQTQPPYGTRGTRPSNSGDNGDQVYWSRSTFAAIAVIFRGAISGP